MIRNQAEQISHYSIQAAANAIKALVAAGELSPYAPPSRSRAPRSRWPRRRRT
ncbi:hypothetical protein AB5I41_09225 [Sphingomonas sp. MMS24-JH45]